jgi:predicted nucleic acid-binding protein
VIDGPLLFDTNVLIYILNGDRRAALTAVERGHAHAISSITWMEVMVGATPANAASTQLFLDRFEVIETTREIAARAVAVRQSMRLKLPDAIVYASALSTGRTLVTFNERDFPSGTPWVHTPDGEG